MCWKTVAGPEYFSSFFSLNFKFGVTEESARLQNVLDSHLIIFSYLKYND